MSKPTEISKTLGGARLGSGNKNDINLHAYNRSTHDLSRAWRSSMTVGTLVPFLVEPGLPGDDFSIDLATVVRTMPAVGPLYGSYKLQLDVFSCPIRLYNGLLHNNMTKIGMNMEQVKLPKITIETRNYNRNKYNYVFDNSQISKSALLNYLGINGIMGCTMQNTDKWIDIKRDFNAVPILAYYDIYKNYYANKQEEIGHIIKSNTITETNELINLYWRSTVMQIYENGRIGFKSVQESTLPAGLTPTGDTFQQLSAPIWCVPRLELKIKLPPMWSKENIQFVLLERNNTYRLYHLTYLFPNYYYDAENEYLYTGQIDPVYQSGDIIWGMNYESSESEVNNIAIQDFPLENIDNARIAILQNTGLNNQVMLNTWTDEPWITLTGKDSKGYNFNKYTMNGLALKTYQSDLLNNWLQTEWLTNIGGTGINDITAVDTSGGSFTIDALNLSYKVYKMMIRVAVSGGTYEDYIEAVYSTEALKRAETPMYVGGMSSEIVFEEVVSTAVSDNSPLGSLAGKGTQSNIRGGAIEIKCNEPCFIIGIASITPRIDYSQGNKWFMTDLDNMADLHKPALDGIGFEDLMAERAAWWGTNLIAGGGINALYRQTLGKVPAWINYMTAINETHGDFAEENKTMFMTLNRRYEVKEPGGTADDQKLSDPTTYINPTKYNYVFADTALDAQNFWVQIGLGIKARRVMSAKIMPSL